MNRVALAAALALLPTTARADQTAAIVGWSTVGALDVSFLVFDAVTIARHKAPGIPYAVVETVLAAPQLVVGALAIGVGAESLSPTCGGFFCSRDSAAFFFALGASLAVLAAAALAHGIWALATRGWGNAARVH